MVLALQNMSVTFRGCKMCLHRATGLFGIVLTDRPVNCPMLPQSGFGHSRHFVGAAAHLSERRRDSSKTKDCERITRGRRNRFVETDVRVADGLVKNHSAVASTAVHFDRSF